MVQGRQRRLGDGVNSVPGLRDPKEHDQAGDRRPARLIVETVVFWAVHRRWDPHPEKFDDSTAGETVVDLLTDAFVRA